MSHTPYQPGLGAGLASSPRETEEGAPSQPRRLHARAAPSWRQRPPRPSMYSRARTTRSHSTRPLKGRPHRLLQLYLLRRLRLLCLCRPGLGVAVTIICLPTEGTMPFISFRLAMPHIARLHEEIVDFANWINPWTDEQRMRDWVADKITLIIHELWPKVQVRIYGSFHTNLYLPSRYVPSRPSGPKVDRLTPLTRLLHGSDIDIVVIGAPSESNNQLALLQLADRLHARGETTMHVIPTAKVRCLHFYTVPTTALASPLLLLCISVVAHFILHLPSRRCPSSS